MSDSSTTSTSIDMVSLNHIRDFLLDTRRRDARGVSMKKYSDGRVKFTVRCSRAARKLMVADSDVALRVQESLVSLRVPINV